MAKNYCGFALKASSTFIRWQPLFKGCLLVDELSKMKCLRSFASDIKLTLLQTKLIFKKDDLWILQRFSQFSRKFLITFEIWSISA